jgi:hypothetical protein
MGIGKFAAGNLFTGTFAMSGLNGLVQFGRDFHFTAKPTSMSFWMKHNQGNIDEVGSGSPADATGVDKLSAMVLITAWDTPHLVDTANPDTFISPDNITKFDGIIGYGSLERNQSMSSFEKFSIPIEYRNNRKPTTCVIVCSSSKYGDYFVGAVGSVLLVDEFEFTF